MFSWNYSRTRCANRHNNIFSYKVRRKYLPQLKRLVVNDLDQIANELLAREQSIGTIPASNRQTTLNGAPHIRDPKSDFWLERLRFSHLNCRVDPGGSPSVELIGYNKRNKPVFRVCFGYTRLSRDGLQSEANDAYLRAQDRSIASSGWTEASSGATGNRFSQSLRSRPFSSSMSGGWTGSHGSSDWWRRVPRSLMRSQPGTGSHDPDPTRLDYGDRRSFSSRHY